MSSKEESQKCDDDWEKSSESDPFASDNGGSDWEPSDKEYNGKNVTTKEKEKCGAKRRSKKVQLGRKRSKNSGSGGAKKSKREIANESKMKLASFVQKEGVIYNLQHKLHSNVPALSAAWQRVATQMEKNGNYF